MAVRDLGETPRHFGEISGSGDSSAYVRTLHDQGNCVEGETADSVGRLPVALRNSRRMLCSSRRHPSD